MAEGEGADMSTESLAAGGLGAEVVAILALPESIFRCNLTEKPTHLAVSNYNKPFQSMTCCY